MNRRIKSLLLATVAASSLGMAQPAQALLPPAYDCGYVAIRDIVDSSSNTWITAEYAWVVAVPAVHSNVRITCFLQTSDDYGSELIPGTQLTCETTAVCVDTDIPSSYVNPAGAAIYVCKHVVWDDAVTGLQQWTFRDLCRKHILTLPPQP